MKRADYLLRVALTLFAVALMVTSCRKDETPVYSNFISNEIVASFPSGSVITILDFAGDVYPELDALKSYVAHDINVYKLNYSTIAGGQQIKASGLVCVPADKGEYPVLSFQNGTNTLYSEAPTENPTGSFYEFIEFISAMGYIVVIPDYPGFGESEEIPHPYLIAEPTIQSVADMLRAVKESCRYEFGGVSVKNEYYLMGYSQGGWSTLWIHKALELQYKEEFNLAGSVCGAGPYNMYDLMTGMMGQQTYLMPAYLGYIVNAYSAYHCFTNPVTDLLKEPYASRIGTLYNGSLSLDQINSQLTTTINDLFTADFLAGFTGSAKYATVKAAMINNSIEAWKTEKPLMFVHGTGDLDVSVTSTEKIYAAMIESGTSDEICTRLFFPGLDHGEAAVPAMAAGLEFLLNLRDN